MQTARWIGCTAVGAIALSVLLASASRPAGIGPAGPPASRPAAPLRMGIGTAPPASRSLELPDAAAIAKAQAGIRNLYRDDYASGGQSQRQTLAKKLLQQAIETHDDAASRYALLCEARDVGAAAKDAATALRAVDQLATDYGLAPLPLKHIVLSTAARFANAKEAEIITRCALAVVNTALQEDDFDMAERVVSLTDPLAARTRNAALAAQVQEAGKEARQQKQECDQATTAHKALANNPTDGHAARTAGRYAAFMKGDWENGLKWLALSSDPVLKGLAERDRPGIVDPQTQRQLADDWWAFAETCGPVARRHIEVHAASLYRKAAARLSGHHAAVARQRIDTADAWQMKRLNLAPGLFAELFEARNFAGRRTDRVDGQIEFDWGLNAPADGTAKDNFSIRWTGQLRISEAGRYTIVLRAKTAGRLFVDGKQVLESPEDSRKRSGERNTINLSEGLHSLRLEYWHTSGTAHIRIQWVPPGAAHEEPIPASALWHSTVEQ